jgi:hypothetical protein
MIKILSFHIYFSRLSRLLNFKKRLIMTCVVECFQSHCHILKELHEFLRMMGAIIVFGENIFICSFVIID